MATDNESRFDGQAVFIIIGAAALEEGGADENVHIILRAADEDSAVRAALEALASEGYAEADFDQIGTIADRPEEEPHASAFDGALEGDVAIIAFRREDEEEEEPAKRNPFQVLKGWNGG